MKKTIVLLIILGLLLMTLSVIGENTIIEPLSDHEDQLQFLTGLDLPLLPEYVPGQLIVKFKNDVDVGISASSGEDLVIVDASAIYPKGIVKTGVESIDILNKELNVNAAEKLIEDDSVLGFSNVYIFSIDKNIDVFSAAEAYMNDTNVEYAEPNYVYHFCIIPNDPHFNDQWALHNTGQTGGTPDADIDAPEAWDIEKGSPDVVIAIIDTGVDYTHPDLSDNIWINEGEDRNHNGKFDKWPSWLKKNGVNGDINRKDDDGNGYVDDIIGWEFAGKYGIIDDNDPMDNLGHGTICAGIVGAVGNNGLGISGVTWNCKIMSVKIGNKNVRLSNVVRGIIYAAENNADVISMSFGGLSTSEAAYDAIKYAYSRGSVLVAGAGNFDIDLGFFPAAYDEVIAVAATNSTDERAEFSMYGSWVDIAAPGVDILSLRAKGTDIYGDGSHIIDEIYYVASGTSMACPFVSGLIGLLLSKNNSLTQDMVTTILYSSVDEIDTDYYIGCGRINAFEAIKKEPALAIIDVFPNGGDVKGFIDITGSAWAKSFQYYIIDYGIGKLPDSWIKIVNSTYPVEDDVLASLDTTVLNEGVYTLRLKLFCGDFTYEKTIQIVVNNKHDIFIVDDDGGLDIYTFIQDAIDDAGNGDDVYVHNGTYYENIIIERSIVLTGENKDTVIIDGNDSGIVICILADNVEITGFTIQNASSTGKIYIRNHIYVRSNNNVIHGNNLINNTVGILLGIDVADNLIYHNNFVKKMYPYPILHVNAIVMVKRNGNLWYNPEIKQGNYWSDYSGFDILPPWGIGDIPKRIFPFFLGHKDKYPLMKPYGSDKSILPENLQINSQSQSSIKQFTTTSISKIFQQARTK